MNGKTGKQYWRSLNELADTPELRALVEREFPQHASEWLGDFAPDSGASRRAFLKIMGASVALAGLASCRRWPAEDLAPYAHRPANRMDGVPVHYATAMEVGGMGLGVLAVSFDGRPIKVDGNPSHPLTRGASDIFLQASVLGLYDPDRSRSPVSREGGARVEKSWADFANFAKDKLKTNGAGMVILSEASRSPSVAAMRKRLPEAKWFEYEAVSNDIQRAGAKLFFGRPLRAVPQLDKAAVIVSLDADLFHGDPMSIKYNRDFAAGRKLHDSAHAKAASMNRLYVLESGFTLTGSMADHRRGIKMNVFSPAVKALANVLAGGQVTGVPPEMVEFLTQLARDLNEHKGRAVLVAGPRLSPDIHAAVAAINHSLNAPIDYYAEPEDPRREETWTPHSEQIAAFAQAATGAQAIVIIGANPALTAPVGYDIPGLLKKARLSIHAGLYEDETAQSCTWHLPLAHYLEAWGDVRTFDGAVSITQPLIEPLFGAKSTIEILSLLSGQQEPGKDIVRAAAQNDYLQGRFSEWNWKQALFNGVVENSARKPEIPMAGNAFAVFDRLAGQYADAGGFQLVLTTGQAYDGRYANNGWLMELPDPMTRVSWGNPLIISPDTAAKLGVQSDDVVTITSIADPTSTIEATIFVLPGQPNNVFSLAVGYGRKGIGSVSENVGVNAYALSAGLRPIDVTDPAGLVHRGSFLVSYLGFIPITVDKLGDKTNPLACVQDHHIIDTVGKDRMHSIVPEIVVEGTFAQYVQKPQLATRKVLSLSMFNERNYDTDKDGHPLHKWGMAIDLTSCTGCSACVIACQSENNIPVVGKEMVYRGREMHWLRIDRYFKWARRPDGSIDESDTPQAVHQPLMCVHCENAPCEEVCPVAATTHSHEGLNMMTYNRCIGTRYCSNNCPYKVRRFNFFDYNSGTTKNLYTPNLLRDDINELAKMSKNPQVTVRSRGVMEKCSYCVQRIENARIEIRAQNRGAGEPFPWKDGTVVTACQQACPAGAIVFGDLNDKNSRVARLHELAQSYALLDPELNTKPRTQYLAKIRNPLNDLDAPIYNSEKHETSNH